MKIKTTFFSLFVLVLSLYFTGPVFSTENSDPIREYLRNHIETAGFFPKFCVGKAQVCALEELPKFYEIRAYQPVWIENNKPNKRATDLITAIEKAGDEGLRSEDYHLPEILIAVETIKTTAPGSDERYRRLVDLELLCTDAFMLYGSHLVCGRVNPETIDAEWHANRRGYDMAAVLRRAIEADDIAGTLKQLLPRQKEYARLQEALAHYRHIQKQEKWPEIAPGPKLEKGDSNSRVAQLIRRLAAEYPNRGDEIFPEKDFNEMVLKEVTKFQVLNGLEPDGVVGKMTLAALNMTPQEKIRRIEINMERWRWLPEDLGDRYILVNMADFHLYVVENDYLVMDMRVIVGKDYRRTPVFSDRITYLVLNPYWNVPPSIAVKDKLPLIKSDPGYLAKQGMKLFQGWDSEAKEIDPGSVDWGRVTPRNFKYRLRQEPGPLNALGRIKFMFPNQYNVYIHDTPSRELFAKTVRTFSSGCIRIEKPLELAAYLLKDNPKWTPEKILAALERNVEQTISLKPSIPIHLLYWTVLADEGGIVRFRDDIYGRDKLLAEAFYEKAPGYKTN